jgi:hypothetical protein
MKSSLRGAVKYESIQVNAQISLLYVIYWI